MRRTARTLPVLVLATSLALTGCVAKGKDGDSKPESGGTTGAPTAQDTLMDAKKVYDEAASVHLMLESENVPDDVDSVRGAEGVGTHAPAFKGDFKARANGLNLTVPVISVDGKTYVKLPLTPSYQEKDPKDLGAVDPATIFAKDQGIDKVITETKEPAFDGEAKRDGQDKVRDVTGKVPGTVIKEVLGMGVESATYDVRYTITDPAHEIRVLTLVGPFYKEGENNTYRLKLDQYGAAVDIQKP